MCTHKHTHTHTRTHRELVRKKAVMVMHHFYTLSPSSVSHLEDDFRRSISDTDPGVMEAALILFHDMAAVSAKGAQCWGQRSRAKGNGEVRVHWVRGHLWGVSRSMLGSKVKGLKCVLCLNVEVKEQW